MADRNNEVVQATTVANQIINFGKYKSKTIGEISKTDFGYCKWLLNQPFTSDEIKDYIKSNVNVDDYLMSWGKYKNKSVSWINQNDPKYKEWLENNDFVKTKCPKLLEALNAI